MEVTTEAFILAFIILAASLVLVFFMNARYMKRRIRRIHDEYREKIERVTKDRDRKLFAQSKYSEIGMMSAGIAHEINNPLAVIQARTTQLLRIYNDPGRANDLGEGLQQILTTSERINRTVQGIRDFIRQDDKALDQEILLQKVIEDVLRFCGQRFKNHGVNLRLYNLESFKIIGNKIQLEQIFLNLLNNAFDAIEFLPDKWIEITAKGIGSRLQIFVKDSGPGIPSAIASRMMEPFYSTKDSGRGTGMGLALAQGLAQKHGGVLVYVQKSNHTTFMLDLPLPKVIEGRWHRQNVSLNSKELH